MAVIDGELRLACDLRSGIEPIDDEATAARLCWHLARSLVVAGAADGPAVTVDELARRVGGRSGFVFTDAALARAKAHEASQRASTEGLDHDAERAGIEDQGSWTMHDALASGAIDHPTASRALDAAWSALDRVRRDCERAEAAAIELAAARTLASSLGAELERDEWIRARLRRAKATKPVTMLIAARKRALKRE